MHNLESIIQTYLNFCQYQKRLDTKTVKSYRIDLYQFLSSTNITRSYQLSSNLLEIYIMSLHQTYKPKTAKRKIASLKAFFHYMEYKGYIETNPFNRIQIKFREPVILPKTIPLNIIEQLLATMYKQQTIVSTPYQKKTLLRDTAVVELLFATGMRISELCNLKAKNVSLHEKNILIYGKGSKERLIQIANQSVYEILLKYYEIYQQEITNCGYFFIGHACTPLSDQCVRRMLRKYCSLAGVDLHITPHMFRHTFATSLLEADVDIRYIQEMLGHSSIHITEIYTHVSKAKQRDILERRHPRKRMLIQESQYSTNKSI